MLGGPAGGQPACCSEVAGSFHGESQEWEQPSERLLQQFGEKLERQDLVALTMEASQLTGVPMVTKKY